MSHFRRFVRPIPLAPLLGAAATLWVTRPPAATACPPDSCAGRLSLLLGYSFGHASFDAPPPAGGYLARPTGNEPLVAVLAELSPGGTWQADVRLALASFGRLIEVQRGVGTDPDGSLQPDYRRSIFTDLTVRRVLGRSPVYLASSVGFLFDAQGETAGTDVADAKSHLLAGAGVRRRLASSLMDVSLLVGASEVMTDEELFDWSWSDDEDWRFRPRLGFLLNEEGDHDAVMPLPLAIGFWGDFGFSDEAGDTYVVFLASEFWPKPRPEKEPESRPE